MRTGKLTNEELNENVLKVIKQRRNEVIVHPGMGQDCAVFRATDGLAFLSSDPVTGAASNLGALAVHINCNDVAASGAEPLGIMLNILLPPTMDTSAVKTIMESAEEACRILRMDILGGHTEFTSAVNSPVVSATAVGMARKVVKAKGMEADDYIVMTKTAAIEGTWLIAADYLPYLKAKYSEKLSLTEKEEEEAVSYFKKISVLPESRIMIKHEVSSMHDITEGGVYGAVTEMCYNTGLGAEITASKIPVSELTEKICKLMNIDPFRLLSSGSMLCTVKKAKPMIEELTAAGIEACIIGRITDSGKVYSVGKKGIQTEIKSEKDQMYKINDK